MRSFLPIKGPGGRHLTPNEKVALLVLGLTLVFCLLTILAGESAFDPEASRNPIFAVVAALCRWMGGGIVALYALVVVWSGLIYFKGERIAQVAPITGRVIAAFAVMVGVSGALGAASLQTAGALGDTVSAALQRTFGPTAAFPILFGLMILGLHLAGRGAWSALREPTPTTAPEGGGAGMLGFVKTPTPSKTPGGYGIGVQVPLGRRGTSEPMPDDGDPSSEERSVFVARAVADIERRQGVTILEVSEAHDDEEEEEEDEPVREVDGMAADGQADGAGPVARASIGEEVDSAPRPAPGSDEEDVQRRLRAIDAALGGSPAAPPAVDEDEAQEAEDAAVTGRPARDDDDDDDAEAEDEDAEYEDEAYDDDEDAEYDDQDDDDAYEDEDEEYGDEEDGDEEYGDDEEAEDDEDERYGYDDDEEDSAAEADHGFVPVPADDEPDPEPVTPRTAAADGPVQAEFALPEAPEAPEEEEPAAEANDPGLLADEPPDEPARHAPADPYARPGLLDRLRTGDADGAGGSGDRPYTTFDWRGRPVE